MSEDRLAAGVEAAAFLRRAEGAGGFGTVLHKGDKSRGSLLLLVAERGVPTALLERRLSITGTYEWARSALPEGDSSALAFYIERRRRSDPDCWVIELDIPLSERFIAETIAGG